MPNENDPFFSMDDPLEDEPAGKEGRAGRIPEFVRKMAVAGLGAVFLTEEGIRGLASQLKLPKEVLGLVLSQAEKTKEDVTRVLSDELRRFFQSETLREEFLKLLAGTTIEIKAEVRLVPSEKKPEAAPSPLEPTPRAKAPKVVITDMGARRGGRKKKEE